MKKAQLTCICGDFHGDWTGLNPFINNKIRLSKKMRTLAAAHDALEVVILQCGDFGYWPHTDPPHSWFSPGDTEGDGRKYALKTDVDFLKDGRVKIYWCDGNHENHDALDTLEARYPGELFIPVMSGVFFAVFGSILTLLDGTRVMFCGGAASDPEDIEWRNHTPQKSWWPQETIDQADMARLPDPKTAYVDWIVSHTCPHAFEISGRDIVAGKNDDASRDFLDRILEDYRPKRWWFGHYHQARTGQDKGCDWRLLDRFGNRSGRPWMESILLTREE